MVYLIVIKLESICKQYEIDSFPFHRAIPIRYIDEKTLPMQVKRQKIQIFQSAFHQSKLIQENLLNGNFQFAGQNE